MTATRYDAQFDDALTIGARLRLIRIAYGRLQGYSKNMPQSEIARLIKATPASWNNSETGDNRLGIDNAMQLCRVTGVTLDYIYFGDLSGVAYALAIEIKRLDSESSHTTPPARTPA